MSSRSRQRARIVFVRQLFQGKLNSDVRAQRRSAVRLGAGGSFSRDRGGNETAAVETFKPQLDASQIRSKPEEPFREAQRSVDLSAADIIVSVGRGIKEKENCRLWRR